LSLDVSDALAANDPAQTGDEPPDTVPENERPTDPSPPPFGADICACRHYRASHPHGGPCATRCGCVAFAPRQDSQALSPRDGAMALAPAVSGRAEEESAHVSPPGSWTIGPDGHAVLGPRVARRDWLDFGKDTGPRLRVREVADTNDLIPLVEPEPTHDPREVDELHRASAMALRDGDDNALGKIYEDLLDDIHSSDAGESARMTELARAASELQEAITAELREVARSEKNWGWKHTLSEHGIRIRARTPQGEFLECQIDRRGTRALVMQAIDDPRSAASSCVREAREQIHQARARIMVGGFVPVVNEVGQA
jgi:hypothetical protein